MALLDIFSPQTRHNKISGFPSKIESKRNITFIGLSWAHLFYFLLTTTHTWAFIWVRMFQRVLIEYFFLLSIYPLPITAAVSLKASLITLLFEQQLVDTCCHLVEQHLNVLPVTSCCLHRTYEDHYFRWINNVWTNNVKLRLSMAHLIISHSTLMSRGTVVGKHCNRLWFTWMHTHRGQNRSCFHNNTHKLRFLSCYQEEVTPRVQFDRTVSLGKQEGDFIF